MPGKNFRKMCGKPLIEWSIDTALKSKRIDKVVVVTDSQYDHPLCSSLEEPAELASGEVGKWDVWKWAVNELEAWWPAPIQTIVDLDVTRPIRSVEDVDRCIDRFYAQPPASHMVMGVTDARKNPYVDLLEHDASGALYLSKISPDGFTVRQAARKVFQHAGVYVVSRPVLEHFNGLFAEGLIVHGRYLPPEAGLDIDTELDWTMVEAVLKQRMGAIE